MSSLVLLSVLSNPLNPKLQKLSQQDCRNTLGQSCKDIDRISNDSSTFYLLYLFAFFKLLEIVFYINKNCFLNFLL